ncbi:Carboxyesterase 18 [Heracleum sosnowskyi]|uniref:Carboxyesterase 18 n=1 Tax=Heracleum sosnowskyi TaxID=360622 RepID=A0AAD8M0N9_9APIA|nr:Carboxyesterase 18 [Heracleum sosnowskyi]
MSSMDKEAPSLPLKPFIAITVANSLTNLCYKNHDTMHRGLLNFLSKPLLTSSNPEPRNGVMTYDVTVDTSRDLWFRVYIPTATTASLPVIIYFHGGGFVLCSPHLKQYDDFCRRLAAGVQAIVASVNYRLAPEHKYPAQHIDGFDVLKFIDGKKQILPENADLSRCFLAGDSAGGNIAHHVAETVCESHLVQIKVKGLVAIQPFFGGEERTESEKRIIRPSLVPLELLDRFWRSWLPVGDEYNRDHKAVNVTGPEASDLSTLDFPATIVFVGGFDILQDWQRRYYNWLKNAGIKVDLVEYPSSIHGFYGFTELPESHQLITDIRQFVDEQENK